MPTADQVIGERSEMDGATWESCTDGIMLQEIYADDPYKLLVGCIMLNVTTRKQVDKVRDEFFRLYPTADALAEAHEANIAELLAPLGLKKRRAAILVKFARCFRKGLDLENCPGVGPYARDSYRIFHLGDTSRFDSGDKEIAGWFERQGIECPSTP